MLAVLCVFYVISCADRLIITMLVEPIKRDLSLSDTEMGVILGPAFAIFYALFGVPLGWAADRYSRRMVIFGGSLVYTFATAASGLAGSFGALLACRIAVGAGEAALTPAAYTLMADRFPRRRLTLAMSIYQTSFQVGNAVALGLGGLLIATAGTIAASHLPFLPAAKPWQIALALIGLPGAMLSFLVFTFAEPPRRAASAAAAKRPTGEIFHYMWEDRQLYGKLIGGFTLVTICAYSLSSWAPTYMGRQFGWHPRQFGPPLGLISLIAGSSMVVKGWIVDYLYGRGLQDAHLRFYSWLLAVSVPIAFVTFLVQSPIGFLVCYGALQTICLQFAVYLIATVQLVAPRHLRGQTIAMLLAILSIVGLGLGPLVTGFLTDKVFRDETRLGTSLAIVIGISLPVAFICIRRSLTIVRHKITQADLAHPAD